MRTIDLFDLTGKTAVVTGGEGLLGKCHREVIEELGGKSISADIKTGLDITNQFKVRSFADKIGRIDILINNAVGSQLYKSNWDNDIAVGLTGAWNMCQAFGPSMKNGVILNIGSDMSLIAPDQRLYPKEKPKPVSYSVVKHGIVGLTKYVATLWPDRLRCNCLCPGGIQQDDDVHPEHLIPLGRRARLEEMKGPVAFLISEASSYMPGAILSVDGGRTAV